jgi:hypothetical protein
MMGCDEEYRESLCVFLMPDPEVSDEQVTRTGPDAVSAGSLSPKFPLQNDHTDDIYEDTTTCHLISPLQHAQQ